MINNMMDMRGTEKPKIQDEAMRQYLMARRQSLLTETDQIERLLDFKDNERTSEIRKAFKDGR